MNADLGAIGATYNLTMDPYEKYDMTFNGAAPSTVQQASPGKYAGQDNGWVLALISPVMIEFDKSVMKFPNIRRFVGGASTDLRPNLQDPSDPVPLLRKQIEEREAGSRPGRRRLITSSRTTKRGGFGRPSFDSESLEHADSIREAK